MTKAVMSIPLEIVMQRSENEVDRKIVGAWDGSITAESRMSWPKQRYRQHQRHAIGLVLLRGRVGRVYRAGVDSDRRSASPLRISGVVCAGSNIDLDEGLLAGTLMWQTAVLITARHTTKSRLSPALTLEWHVG